MGDDEEDTAVTDGSTAATPLKAEAHDCLVLIHGDCGIPLGKLFQLEGGVVRIGRSEENDIVLQDHRVSRLHAALEQRGSRWYIRDQGSANGTWVRDVRLRDYVALGLGDRIKIGSSIFKFLTGADIESAAYEEIYRLTITDALTNLSNRRELQTHLEKELIRARRYERTFSVMMLDIDHFKIVNDTHGHGAGDAVLAAVAAVLRAETRPFDVVARYGGEEMVVVAVEATLPEAAAMAERIRSAIEAHTVSYDEAEVRVTVSIGCAEFKGGEGSADDLLARADAKLYEAKNGGRNRVAA